MVNSVNDGLNKPDQIAISGIEVGELDSNSVTSDAISGLAVTSAKLGAGAVEASKQGFVGTGSPTGFGLSIQTGSFETSGTSFYIPFPTAFKAAPIVTFHLNESGAAAAIASTLSTATSGVNGDGASGIGYSYVAIGSGDL